MTDDLVERLLDWPYQGETMAHEAAARIEQLTAERDRLRVALTVLHKQALMLRGEQSYREFARAVEKQARAALKGETP